MSAKWNGLTRGAKLGHLCIACSYPAGTIATGASIACGGPCLTVVACGENGNRSWFEVDVGAETLACTTARNWKTGTRLNLERPLKIGDELGGHIVTGHVDGVAEIVAITDFDGMRRIDIRARMNSRDLSPKRDRSRSMARR